MLKYTTKEIIKKFKQVHGDKYDYSKFEYLNNRTKSIIICKEHGEFKQSSKEHLRKRGCRKCGYLKVSRNLNKGVDTNIKKYNKFSYVLR